MMSLVVVDVMRRWVMVLVVVVACEQIWFLESLEIKVFGAIKLN